jgi:site-specific DNA-methyltransferase (adenine-specific)
MWEQLKRAIKPSGAVVMTASQPFTSLLGASNLKMLKYTWVWEKGRPTNFPNAKRMPLKGFEDVLVFYRKQPTYNAQGLVKVDKVVKNTGTKTRKDSLKENGDRTSVHNDLTKSESYKQEFTNYPRGVIKFSQDSEALHPTQKPVALMEYLIKTYTNEGETVLDFCAGSGTTAVAAERASRRWILIEREEKYCEIIAKRLDAEAISRRNKQPSLLDSVES